MGMEISAAKSKLLVVGHTPETIEEQVEVSGGPLEQVRQFKYLGCMIQGNGKSIAEVKIRVAMAKAAMCKLSPLWRSRKVRFRTKLLLVNSIVTSVVLYGCEAWTYNEEIEKKIKALEMWCYRRLLGVKWMDKRTNDSVRQQVAEAAGGSRRSLLEVAKERKLRWFGHTTRHPEDLPLAHTIMRERVDGNHRQGRPRRSWLDDIKRWTGASVLEASRAAMDRMEWRRRTHCASTDRDGL